MKLSDRCRKEARDFYLYDNKDCVEWKAADLLDECEQIFAEFAKAGGSGYAFRSMEMLAKLRGD